MNETQTKVQQPAQAAQHEDELCQIGWIHPTLVSLYPENIAVVVDGYKKMFLGKRLKAKGARMWAVIEVYAHPQDATKIMARVRKLKDGQ